MSSVAKRNALMDSFRHHMLVQKV